MKRFQRILLTAGLLVSLSGCDAISDPSSDIPEQIAVADSTTESSDAETAEAVTESESSLAETESTSKSTSTQNTTDQAAQDTQPSEYAVQTTDVVNVRAIADPNGKLLGKLTEGVKLTAYGTYGEWTKISYSGSENGVGFIKTELLKTVE